MKLEIWMIIGAGVAFAAGFGAVTVLLLAVHSEVRRLAKHAEAAHQALVANVRQTLAADSRPGRVATPVVEAVSAPGAGSRAGEIMPAAQSPDPPWTGLIAATTAGRSVSPPAGEFAEPTSGDETGWNPDRRLLVVRLSSRGKSASQIAAALRIPEEEVETFLHVNKLVTG